MKNSEPRVTQLRVQFTQTCTRRFSGAHRVAVLWITDWKRCCGLPNVLCLSQLMDTQWLRSDVMFVSENLFEVIICPVRLVCKCASEYLNYLLIFHKYTSLLITEAIRTSCWWRKERWRAQRWRITRHSRTTNPTTESCYSRSPKGTITKVM